MIEFRELTADEIEVRVGSITEKGCSLLLYKDARCDMKILDETVGNENWEREHYECKGNLFCKVGIRCRRIEPEGSQLSVDTSWVYKSDCGTESNAEKEKGEASDSFKRACFNWGIGRELYTAPFIWVKAENCTIEESYGKLKVKDKFSVEKIAIEDHVITGLAIRNDTTSKRVFVWTKN